MNKCRGTRHHSTMTKAFLGGLALLLIFFTAPWPAISQTCVTPPEGLVSWWPGDGNTDDIIDANPGTLQNGATFAAGKVGQAFSFDGVDDFVEVADSANLTPASAITVDAWFKVDSVGSDMFMVNKFNHNNLPFGDDSYILGIFADGAPRWQLDTLTPLGPSDTNLKGSATVVAGQFHHIAGTYDGSTMKLYLDGVLVGSVAKSGSIIDDPQSLLIGAALDRGTLSFFVDGIIDEVEIYDRALSAEEIQATFNAGSAGKCKVQHVAIDIKPGSDPNAINPRSTGVIPVAILTTDTFDATTVNADTVFFGATGAEAAPVRVALEDVDGDLDTDMVLHFKTQETGIICGDTLDMAFLTGQTLETFGGQEIEGSDSIKMVGCK